jgi:hypothetical protein
LLCGHFENDSISPLRTTRFRFKNDSIPDPADRTDEFRPDFFAHFLARKNRGGSFLPESRAPKPQTSADFQHFADTHLRNRDPIQPSFAPSRDFKVLTPTSSPIAYAERALPPANCHLDGASAPSALPSPARSGCRGLLQPARRGDPRRSESGHRSVRLPEGHRLGV